MSGIVGGLNTRGSGLILSSATDGQVFMATGAGMSAGFEALATGGGVLQVKYGEATAAFSTTSSTLTAITGMSVAITPASSSNKILVIAQVGGFSGVGTGFSQLQLMRDSTAIHEGDSASTRDTVSVIHFTANSSVTFHPTIVDLDDPSSTSEIVYTLHGKCEGSNTLSFNQYFSDTDHAIQGARAASGMMAIEVDSSVL